MLDNFKYQIFGSSETDALKDLEKSVIVGHAINIIEYFTKIISSLVFDIRKETSVPQDVRDDMLHYHEDGAKRAKCYIEYQYFRDNINKVKITQRKLKTFPLPKPKISKL